MNFLDYFTTGKGLAQRMSRAPAVPTRTGPLVGPPVHYYPREAFLGEMAEVGER